MEDYAEYGSYMVEKVTDGVYHMDEGTSNHDTLR